MADASLLSLSPADQDLLFRAARTANTFTDEPVTDAQVEAIYDLIQWGPTAMNTQPLRVLLVRSPEARAKLVPLMSGSNQPKTANAPLVAILAADTSFHENLPVVFPHFQGAKESMEGSPEKDAARAQTALFNATLQAGYFLIGVRAAGFAAGPMGGFNKAAVDEAFFPGGTLKSILVVNIGHPGPNAWRDRLPRLSYAQVVKSV